MCSFIDNSYFFFCKKKKNSHSGSRITEQLQEESKTWDGELMVVFGFLFVEGDFILAKAQG
jgi:hypothetical protein